MRSYRPLSLVPESDSPDPRPAFLSIGPVIVSMNPGIIRGKVRQIMLGLINERSEVRVYPGPFLNDSAPWTSPIPVGAA